MSDTEMTLRGRILLLVPIYLLAGGFLLQNPYLPVMALAVFSLFIYSRYHFNHEDQVIRVEQRVSPGGKYMDEKFSVYQKIVSNQPLYMELELDNPEDIEPKTEKSFSGVVYPEMRKKHVLVPKNRGNKKIGGLTGYVYDSMKLHRKPFEHPSEIEITVHSSKEAIKRAERYAKRSKGEELIKNIQKFVTRTSELETIRDYQPGDRLRDIDWKGMSKFQKLMTKEYEKRAPVECQVLLDASPSMRRGSEGRANKLDHSIYVALELLKNFDLAGHDFGITVFNHKKTLFHQSPDHRRDTFQRIYRNLSDLPGHITSKGYRGGAYDMSQEVSDETEIKFSERVGKFITSLGAGQIAGIYSALQMLQIRGSKQSLVIIISDMETATSSFIKVIENLKSQDRDVWVIVPFSPWYEINELTEKNIEKTYMDFEDLEEIIHELNRLEVSTFLLHPDKEGFTILTEREVQR